MIGFDEALSIVMAAVRPMPTENVPLSEALGRVLASDIVSDRDCPPCSLSAMDGFACKMADQDKTLTVVESIAAGSEPSKVIGEGECSRIMTGAVVPDGADTVVMFEHTEEDNGKVRVVKKDKNRNIRVRAEDLKKGDEVLSAGAFISPIEIAVLASVGCEPVSVATKPKVGVIATGNELMEPSAGAVGPAQIRNSNSYQLCGQIRRAGCDALYVGIAKDSPEAIEGALQGALNECDVVLLSGGVSAGDFDYVPSILKKAGIDLRFEKVAIKPGKPTVFGVRESQWFFGLPGNPVSTFVLFEMLVKPFLFALMGHEYKPLRVRATLSGGLKRRKTERMEFRPVWLAADGIVTGASYHGSAHIHAYTRANGVVVMPSGVGVIEDGAAVDVILL